jgi:hypothetical protein
LLCDGAGYELSNDRRRSAALRRLQCLGFDLGFKLGLSLGFGPLLRAPRAGRIRELTQPRSKRLLLCLGAYNLYIMGIELEIFSKSYCTTNISILLHKTAFPISLYQISQVQESSTLPRYHGSYQISSSGCWCNIPRKQGHQVSYCHPSIRDSARNS